MNRATSPQMSMKIFEEESEIAWGLDDAIVGYFYIYVYKWGAPIYGSIRMKLHVSEGHQLVANFDILRSTTSPGP